ncbi:family 16 glycosylhydrolase [Phenylobacterium sp.]|uniref:family 16 glycosylhydrolase n=1 Tax=Phenylobacterium sp. TaxID=1871053 RepID=UPI002737C667|nr:family 16 glycosylhydrolase [Phenylobacterium sp.]MDP3869255.1 family 16 glycosylhydrolase [Phenylobacterium sp.]
MSWLKYDGSVAVGTNTPVSDLYGTDGRETLTGTADANSLWGGQGDRMVGGAGDDTYYLKSSSDQVVEQANGGVDKIVAWSNVYLPMYAEVENLEVNGDRTYGAGGAGDNIIQGGAGSQQLYGGGGQDILIGGAGSDVFVVVKGEGGDVIQDFSPGEDVIRLTGGYTSFGQVQAHLTQVGGDVKLDLGGGDGLMLRNLTVSQLSAQDFELQLDPGQLGAMTFRDEFDQPLSLWDAQSNPTGVWRPDYGYQGEQGLGSYTLATNNEKQVYVSPYFRGHAGDFAVTPFTSNADGTLSIQARPTSNPETYGYDYTSGMISTRPTFSQTYGYFEMRADLPEAAGAWPAFWLLPADGSWPPELDVMETLSSDPRAAWTTAHSGLNGDHVSSGQAAFVPDTADGFHTYGVLWTATSLKWYVDGVEVFQAATPADMNKPMYMIANLALGGWGGAIDQGALPAEMKIDYIRAYALPGTVPTDTAQAGSSGLRLTASGYADTLTGGAGADSITAGQGPDRLTGGDGADAFVFKNLPWNAGHITDFQVGVDKIDLSALYEAGYSGADPVADGHVSFVSDGLGGTKVMLDIDGPASGHPWAFTIATLDGVSPVGLTAAKVFGETATPTGATPGSPPPSSGGVALQSETYRDHLTGGSGSDTLNAGQGPDVLTGGAGADSFAFANLPWNAGHITDFVVGVDRLDLSAFIAQSHYTGADPIADGYLVLRDDGAGGSQVLWDVDGRGIGNPWPITVTTLDGVRPGDLTAAKLMTPTGTQQPSGLVVASTGPAASLNGTAGADTFMAGRYADVLTGGAGADHFVFRETPWNAGHITDFAPGSDVLDLRAIFAAANYRGSDPLMDGYFSLQSDGAGGVRVFVDIDGPQGAEWPFLITTLDHVALNTIRAGDWLFH